MRDRPSGSPPSADLRTHRPPWAPLAAAAWLVVAVLLLADLVRRGDGHQVLTGLLALGATVPPAWVFGLQVRLVELPDGVEVVNPLRRVRLRWSDVRDVVPRDVLVIVTTDGEVRCGAVVGRGRAVEAGRQATRLRYPSAADDLFEPAEDRRSEPGAVAARLVDQWERAGGPGQGRGPAPRLAWHLPSVALVLLAVALAVAAALV